MKINELLKNNFIACPFGSGYSLQSFARATQKDFHYYPSRIRSRFFIVLLFLQLLSIQYITVSNAQKSISKNVQLSAYTEAYYAINTGIDSTHNQTPDVFCFNKNRECNINLAMLKLAYNTDNIRSNIALMFGTYPQANMSAEQATLKNIMEANMGIKLSKKHNLWLDAGILPSHIGLESAIGKDNSTLTRSLLADNSPYFETGARLSYTTANSKWNGNINVLNGWQNIAVPNSVNSPSTGLQIQYKPNANLTINYSNFIGKIDKTITRLYNNFYIDWQLKHQFKIQSSVDFGSDLNPLDNTKNWYAFSLIAKKTWKEKQSIALRAEYYNDPNQVMLRDGNGIINREKIFSQSINYDYQISPNALWRIEAKNVNSMGALWLVNGHNNYAIFTTSLSVAF